MLPIILAGGSGSRLWPLSRGLFPKQFLALHGEQTMLQQTWMRLRGLSDLREPVVVCNEDHRFIAAEQMRQLGVERACIVLEPVGRNTAPAIAAAALTVSATKNDPVLLVLPADHLIRDVPALHDAIATGRRVAESGKLVTFGIKPQAVETGYGYVKAKIVAGEKAWQLDRFIEKPNAASAEEYLKSGEYFWNSGMFMFKASVYLAELEAFAPDIAKACRAAMAAAVAELDFVRLGAAAFRGCRSDSIDYAVMEKTDKAMVVPLDAGWSDVGSWSALWDVADQDGDGNVCTGDVIAVDTHNSYLHSASGRLLVSLGMDDVVVVETADAILVARKDRVQHVKKVVEQLAAAGRKEAQQHRMGYRPWGTYDSVDQGGRYQVKRITVKPGARLSVQMHHHRAEHWVVVTGTAKVRIGEQEMLLTENQSTYIPIGTVHSLENPGKVPLELIEVQSGGYLGEDDIVRLEDSYGRANPVASSGL